MSHYLIFGFGVIVGSLGAFLIIGYLTYCGHSDPPEFEQDYGQLEKPLDREKMDG